MPAFFAGLRIAAAYTVGGAVIAEFVNPNGGGLGVFITRSRQSYAVDRIFVAVVIIGLLTAALFAAVDLAARLGFALAARGDGGAQGLAARRTGGGVPVSRLTPVSLAAIAVAFRR